MITLLIRWHGHSCFEIVTGIKIVIDPHNGRSIGIRPPKIRADVVLVTHDHFDHNAVHVVSGKPDILKNPGKYHIENVNITGIPAYHDKVNGAKRGKVTMFKIQSEGLSLLHVGDLGHVPDAGMLDEIGKVDILMIPVGGTYTLNGAEAAETAGLIGAKVVIPMHYKLPGLSLGIAPVDEFLENFSGEKIMHVGNEVDIARTELPATQEIWVFSY